MRHVEYVFAMAEMACELRVRIVNFHRVCGFQSCLASQKLLSLQIHIIFLFVLVTIVQVYHMSCLCICAYNAAMQVA